MGPLRPGLSPDAGGAWRWHSMLPSQALPSEVDNGAGRPSKRTYEGGLQQMCREEERRVGEHKGWDSNMGRKVGLIVESVGFFLPA